MHYLLIGVVLLCHGLVKSAEYSSDEFTQHELPCILSGGLCLPINECPEDNLSEVKGLCPVQQKSGVECCHGLPVSETRCRRRGGECVSSSYTCPEALTFNKASDCYDDEKCCILVK